MPVWTTAMTCADLCQHAVDQARAALNTAFGRSIAPRLNSTAPSCLPGTRTPVRSRSIAGAAPLHSSTARFHRGRAGGLRVSATAATAPAPAPSEAVAPPPALPSQSEEGLRIPRCLAEIDNGKILGFGADLSEDHPARLCSLASACRCAPPLEWW